MSATMSTSDPPSSPFMSAPLPSPSGNIPAQHFTFPPARASAPNMFPPMSPAMFAESANQSSQEPSSSQQEIVEERQGQSEAMEMDTAVTALPLQAPMQPPQQARPPPPSMQSQQQPLQQPAQLGDPAGSFLRDFNLVAEAAKRAQIAVLMRDMGDVALS